MLGREVRPFIKFLKERKNLIGAEIGVECGENAKVMFEELDIKTLYLIDVFDTYSDLMYEKMIDHGVVRSKEEGKACYNGAVRNLHEYMDRITWIIDLSENAVDKINEELDFVYIDGNHRYEYVKKDIVLYFQKVKAGGVIGGHDFKAGEKGVIQAVTEFFGSNYYQEVWDWWAVVDKR